MSATAPGRAGGYRLPRERLRDRVPKRRGRHRGEPTNSWFRIGMAGVGVPAGLLFRLRYLGFENLPRTGGAIVAVNHISYADPVVVGRFVYDAGRLPRYLAKDGLFDVPVVGTVLRGMGQVPVHRGGPDAGRALVSAVAALRRGEIVIVYPEGTVTRDPEFWPAAGKTGIARLALMAPEIPVIPMGQWGAQVIDVYRRSYRLLPRREATVAAGPAVDLARFRAGTTAGTATHGGEDAPGQDGPTVTGVLAGPVADGGDGPGFRADTLRRMTAAIMAAVTDQVELARGQTRPSAPPAPRSTDGPADGLVAG